MKKIAMLGILLILLLVSFNYAPGPNDLEKIPNKEGKIADMKVNVGKGGNMAVGNEPKTIYVEITCVDGEILCDPDEFEVYRGDFIEWSCPGDKKDNYLVILAEKTPFSWKFKVRKRGQKLRDKIKDEADYDEYKYYVIVTEGPNLWIVDPIFIVRRH